MPQVNYKRESIKRERNSYSIRQKEQVIAYANIHGRNKAANYFALNSSMVGRWMKKTWISEINKNNKKTGSGRTAFYPEAEQQLYDWIIAQRKQGIAVNYVDMRAKMLEILRNPDIIFLYGASAECCRVSSC